MKRVLGVLLSVSLLLGAFPVPAAAVGYTITQAGYIAPDAGYQPVNNNAAIENDRLLVSNGDNSGNALYGYADTTGELVIPLQYRDASVFHDGAAVVILEDRSRGLIDPEGTYIVEPGVYESIGAPNGDGLFCVHGHGYMDSHGQIVIPFSDYNATTFVQGYGYFQEGRTVYAVHWDEDGEEYVKEVQCELPENMTLGSTRYAFSARNFTNDIISPIDYTVVRQTGGKVGVIDRTGKIVIPVENANIELSPDGFAVVTKSYERDSTGVIRLSDGKEVLPCTYSSNDILVLNGFITVGHASSGGTAAYNSDGKLIFTCQSGQSLGNVAPGVLEIYQQSDGLPSGNIYVDAQGKLLMDHCYVHLPFSEGLTYGHIYAEDGRSETWIINESFEKVAKLDNKLNLEGRFSRGYAFGTLRSEDRKSRAQVLVDARGNIAWQSPMKTYEDTSSYGFIPKGFDENGYLVSYSSPGGSYILRMVEATLENFVQTSAYLPDTFNDVPEGEWYSEGIKTVYELGLMKGVSENSFDLNGTVTVSAALTMAARLHSIYYTGVAEFDQTQGSHWYDVYVNYCRKEGIFTRSFDDYNRPATRAEFAAILAGALPAQELQPQREWEDDSIPDVKMKDNYAAQIYTLYRAGVLTGNDTAGTFTPDSQIGRSAAATIMARMALPELRAK